MDPSRKRRLSLEDEEEEDSLAGKRPTLMTSIDNLATDSPEFIENFKKDAIWRELQLYKNQVSLLKEQLNAEKSKVARAESNFALVHLTWKTFEADLIAIHQTLDSDNSEFDLTGPFLSLLYSNENSQSELSSSLKQMNELFKNILSSIIKRIENVVQASNFQDSLATIHSRFKETQNTKDQLYLKEQQVKELEEIVEKVQNKLVRSFRKIQRLESAIAQNVYSGSNVPESKVEETKSQTSEMTLDQKQFVNTTNLAEIEELKEKVGHFENLAEWRFQEYKRVESERKSIQEEFNSLYLDLKHMNPERLLKESPDYKAMYEKCEYLQQEADVRIKSIEELSTTVNNLESTRRILQESIINEESSRRQAMESEFSKIVQDLNRVRSTRDHLQTKVDKMKERTLNLEEQIKALEESAEFAKSRIISLTNENKRLKLTLVSKSEDPDFYKNVYLELNGSSDSEPSEARDLYESLNNRLKTAESLLIAHGIKESPAETSSLSKPAENKDLEEYEKALSLAKMKIQIFEETQAGALSEIEAISESFTKLEAKQVEKDNLLKEKNEELNKASIERNQLQQKLAIIQKEKDSVNNKSIALSKQSTKQNEYIKRLEAEKRAKELLLVEMDKQVSDLNILCSVHERKAQSSTQSNSELESKIEIYQKKTSEVYDIFKAKEEIINDLRSKLAKLEEENKKIDSRLTILQRKAISEDSTEENSDINTLKKQIQDLKDWKRIAQCSVCEFRIKSHCLLKCMHVFCKECIDTRVETRQRKCPQCGLTFGTNEIKQIYI